MVMPLTKSKKLDESAARSAESAAQSEVGVAAMSTTLVADIGGSKSRFALSNSSGELERVLVIDNDTVAGLDAAVAYYLEETGARPRAATLAVAGSVGGEEVVLTNRSGWRLRRAELANRIGLLQLRVLNAFEAIAWALPLTFKALGGVYITGGVACGLGPLLDEPQFRAAFEAHPPYATLLKTIPALLITCEQPGLIGCAAVPTERALTA